MRRTLTLLLTILSATSLYAATPTATIDKVWLEHDVKNSAGNKAMRVHTKFHVYNFLNRTGNVAIWLKDKNNNWLKIQSANTSTTGTSYISELYRPAYENCVYEDFKVDIPLKDLSLPQGSNTYYVVVTVNDDNGKILAQSSDISFTGTGSAPAADSGKPNAIIDKVWLEHDVTNSAGNKSMRIHAKFHVNNFLGQTGSVTFWIKDSNNKWIKMNSGNTTSAGVDYFRSEYKPAYKNSVYEDFKFDIPLNALTLSPGINTYYVVVTVNDNNGNILAQSSDISVSSTNLNVKSSNAATLNPSVTDILGYDVLPNTTVGGSSAVAVDLCFKAENIPTRGFRIAAYFEIGYGTHIEDQFVYPNSSQIYNVRIAATHSDLGVNRSQTTNGTVKVKFVDREGNTFFTLPTESFTITARQSSTKKSTPKKSTPKQQTAPFPKANPSQPTSPFPTSPSNPSRRKGH